MHFGENFKKQKLQGTPNLVGAGHLIGPQIWIWKDLGPMCFWSSGLSLSRRVYKIPFNSAWPLGQGIGLEWPAGPWKANVWLSQHTLLFRLKLKFQYFLKPHLNHPGQCWVAQASKAY